MSSIYIWLRVKSYVTNYRNPNLLWIEVSLWGRRRGPVRPRRSIIYILSAERHRVNPTLATLRWALTSTHAPSTHYTCEWPRKIYRSSLRGHLLPIFLSSSHPSKLVCKNSHLRVDQRRCGYGIKWRQYILGDRIIRAVCLVRKLVY